MNKYEEATLSSSAQQQVKRRWAQIKTKESPSEHDTFLL